MSVEPENYISEVVRSAGGRLVSRIRLQKIVYLLDQLGANSGFEYRYYHYGPYSRGIDNAVLDAEAFDLLEETFDNRQSDGARYSIFVAPEEGSFSSIDSDELRSLVKYWSNVPAVELELAATAHWLVKYEKADDWRKEIVKRKGSKTGNGRLEKSLKLLSEVGLPPGTLAA